MNIESIKNELDNARNNRCLRAAFGSIVCRHYDEIKNMTRDQKRQLLKELGVTENYYAELQKELTRVAYDKNRRYTDGLM